ncbi:K(+)-transporting ATPase subunit F [Ancylobacter defluvii]|uniref:K(+)-transporting ATPase subunit F n=2 Tax=Ancylobacter defluvii TaxID=1282440 RepID=UPI001BD184DF|nr:K(+)-transporting ATPase subunit F [Ancylobacter defluvii]
MLMAIRARIAVSLRFPYAAPVHPQSKPDPSQEQSPATLQTLGALPWQTSFFSLSASPRSPPSASMRAFSPGSREAAIMIEPILGLAVAVALGFYLVVTLLRPERF